MVVFRLVVGGDGAARQTLPFVIVVGAGSFPTSDRVLPFPCDGDDRVGLASSCGACCCCDRRAVDLIYLAFKISLTVSFLGSSKQFYRKFYLLIYILHFACNSLLIHFIFS